MISKHGQRERKMSETRVAYIYRKTKKICTAFMLGAMLTVTASGNIQRVNAEDTAFVVNENWLPAAQIQDGGGETVLERRGAAFAEKYDARENGWVTPVRNQGNYESCWAFSTIAAIETNLIKNGKADASIDLSENQVAYFFYNRQPDKLGYTIGDYNTTSKGNYLEAGGTLQGTGLALATWAGVTTESKSPYNTIPDSSLCYASDYSIKDVYLYNYNVSKLGTSVATIKQAIMDHGAVACGINMVSTFYNSKNSSYNCRVEGGNHAIAIVGWDDSYSRDNFNIKPAENGAWIVKNSYGNTFGEQGYFYVSYEDCSLTEFIAFEAISAGEQYDNNYQHDGTANPAYSYNKGEWYANVFQAKGANGYNEELKAVGVYTLTTNCNYEVQIYTGLTNTGNPTSGTKVFTKAITGTLKDAGYQTIVLPESVSLTAGESFSVAVRLKAANGANGSIGADSTFQNDWITFISNVSEKQSFVKIGDKWYDFGKEAKANVRVKAYTDVTSKKSSFSLSAKKLGISKGSSAKLSLKMGENVHRNVTWKSSNKKVATVNGNGKVKAKAYGTTTISATFVKGAKKKTLKCQVTVGPAKVKSLKVTSGNKKLKAQWKSVKNADGYELYYAAEKDGTYKKLAAVAKKNSVNKKMKKGTWYVKVRAYKTSGSTKLYGSFSEPKAVNIQ